VVEEPLGPVELRRPRHQEAGRRRVVQPRDRQACTCLGDVQRHGGVALVLGDGVLGLRHHQIRDSEKAHDDGDQGGENQRRSPLAVLRHEITFSHAFSVRHR
jgi:hypothetical protein